MKEVEEEEEEDGDDEDTNKMVTGHEVERVHLS